MTNLAGVSEFADAGNAQQPVLKRLDLDRIRFQEVMRRDAQREERWKKRLEAEKRHHKEDRRRVIPPFQNAFGSVTYSDSLNDTQLTQQKAAMSKMLPLIASGLVVMRWNFEKEVPLVPGAPGIL